MSGPGLAADCVGLPLLPRGATGSQEVMTPSVMHSLAQEGKELKEM